MKTKKNRIGGKRGKHTQAKSKKVSGGWKFKWPKLRRSKRIHPKPKSPALRRPVAIEIDLEAKPTIRGFRKAFEKAAQEEGEYRPYIPYHQYDIDMNMYYWSPETVRKFYQYQDKRNKRKREKQRQTTRKHKKHTHSSTTSHV